MQTQNKAQKQYYLANLGLMLVMTVLLSTAGCTHCVFVVTPTGKPIHDAHVCQLTLSINGHVVKTNAGGVAQVPLNVGGQKTKWVSIHKAGFHPLEVGVPMQWPLRVMLIPADTSKSDMHNHPASPAN